MIRKLFSPERLLHIRRLRKARRLYKKTPVFAFAQMQAEYPGYTPEQFCDDLRRRSKQKMKKGKSNLMRYGRYWRMEELYRKYRLTGNIDFIIEAQKLRQHLTKPYRFVVKLGKVWIEYSFSPLIPITEIEQLAEKTKDCKTEQDIDVLVEQFRQSTRII